MDNVKTTPGMRDRANDHPAGGDAGENLARAQMPKVETVLDKPGLPKRAYTPPPTVIGHRSRLNDSLASGGKPGADWVKGAHKCDDGNEVMADMVAQSLPDHPDHRGKSFAAPKLANGMRNRRNDPLV